MKGTKKNNNNASLFYFIAGSCHTQWQGKGKELTKYEIEHLLHELVIKDCLCENMEPNNNIMCAYIAPGILANKLLNDNSMRV